MSGLNLTFDTSLQYLKGVGPKLGQILSSKGLKTVEDLITYYPRAYEDRRAARLISSLKEGDIVSMTAQIGKVSAIPLGRSHRKMFDVQLRDSSGSINCKFFRVPYRGYFERFTPGQQVRVVGRVINYRNRLEFHHPELSVFNPDEETVISDQLIPIYREIEGVTSTKIAKLIEQVLESVHWAPEVFPETLMNSMNLISKKKALMSIHKPPHEKFEEFLQGKSEAHRRLIFEEFFWLELFLAAQKKGYQKFKAPPLKTRHTLFEPAEQSLPFELTAGQKATLQDILKDFESGHLMNRLLQGDVGSGKTIVAMLASLVAIENGGQVVLMAPTEILAEQHLQTAQKFFGGSGLRMETLTGSLKTKDKKLILDRLASGDIDLLIGTHAVIEAPVKFKNLVFAIIDEQHRFGVEQRATLKGKGKAVHTLIMTATPIPRTLALTVYGDLEVSTIRERPKDRLPIQTRVIYPNKRPQAYDFLNEQLKKGRQAYIIYPLVEESEKIDLQDAMTGFHEVKSRFKEFRVGLLHGRLKGDEKDELMLSFKRHEIDILVSTTVVEVGVDVPNANIIIIEHAERFGLSQLHQLRGRVGRGLHKSSCIMILGKAVSAEAKERTSFLESTNDGFKISEFDLEIRGPGEFLGSRQSGLAGFKLANLVRDSELLNQARDAAFGIFSQDSQLKALENQGLKMELLKTRGPTALAGVG